MLLQEATKSILLACEPADAVLVDLHEPVQAPRGLLDAPEQLQLGVQLTVTRHHVLVLVLNG